jgi:MFS family permease
LIANASTVLPAGRSRVSAPIILGHIAALALTQSTWMGSQFIVPIYAQRQLSANKWETLALTATPTMLFVLSIFWNEVFKTRRLGSYLAIYWLVACLPQAVMGFAQNFWLLLIPHLITCIGTAGYHLVAGELLKSLYPDNLRGRIYSVLWGVSSVIGATTGFFVGQALKDDPSQFRFIMVAVAVLQLAGVGMFQLLSVVSGHAARRAVQLDALESARDAAGPRAPSGLLGRCARIFEPITHMGQILRADPVFARYEAAYMTYGVGWMICYALLPLFAFRILNLNYDQYANATFVAYWLAVVAMILPAGMLMDRLGPVRSTALSFGLLALYPLGLMFVHDYHMLLIVSAIYGIAHAGASMGWMLGPVALAPTPDKVPQYVAIHATLVGVRGAVFQFVGVGLLALFGLYSIPFALAALAFLWSCWQMLRLHAIMSAAKKLAPAAPPSPAGAERAK